jgi:hypothetical protein
VRCWTCGAAAHGGNHKADVASSSSRVVSAHEASWVKRVFLLHQSNAKYLCAVDHSIGTEGFGERCAPKPSERWVIVIATEVDLSIPATK